MPAPTTEVYQPLQEAYDFFNARLFDGKLPGCLITLQRNKKYYGYFWARKFVSLQDATQHTDEIAMNPSFFRGRTLREILSTLTHEMAHLWQQHNGKPGKNGYHNKEWAAKMHAIGLTPQAIGKEPGKETGTKVSHSVVDGGPYARAFDAFMADGKAIGWGDAGDLPNAAKAKPKRIKFVCPCCGFTTQAVPTAKLVCGDCLAEQIDGGEGYYDGPELLEAIANVTLRPADG